MSMYDAIKNFSSQFSYNPEIKNSDKLSSYKWYIVAGMGGSHLAADILKVYNPNLPIIIHKNYGLPQVSDEILKDSLIIISSYSGNTEEALDTYIKAKEKGLPLAAYSVGGKLLQMAQSDGIPYITMPNEGIQPRSALGFSIKALVALMGQNEAIRALNGLLDGIEDMEERGEALAKKIKGFVPLVYASSINEPIAYNWKIKFNETGKIPAFCNVFPELNHNEMTSFDFDKKTKKLSEKFCFIMLYDQEDHPKIQKRMDVTKKLMEDRGLKVFKVELEGKDSLHKIFSSLLLADWTAYYTADLNGAESEQVPMVEEFKKLIS